MATTNTTTEGQGSISNTLSSIFGTVVNAASNVLVEKEKAKAANGANPLNTVSNGTAGTGNYVTNATIDAQTKRVLIYGALGVAGLIATVIVIKALKK